MAHSIRYISFDIPEETHQTLRLLAIERNCSQKALLQEAVISYIQQASELSPLCKATTPQKLTENPEPPEAQGMDGMSL